MGVGLTGWADEVDALYAGDPAAFVAGRDALAKRVRAAGERDAAAAIKGLRRPSVGAWYANVAARASLMSLREWLGLGAEIREAQARLDLRRVGELGGRRAALEDRVVRDLAAHLGALGITAGAAGLEELRGTLRAALADPAAADALASGRLERSLSYAGFGEVDVSAALAAMAADLPVAEPGAASPADGVPAGAAPETSATGEGPPVPPEATEETQKGPDPEEQARAEARADLERRRNSARATLTQLDSRVAAATRDTTAAATARARASEAVEAAERAMKAAQERLQASASQLSDASRTLEAALRAEREATDERARAEAALRAAERDLDAAP